MSAATNRSAHPQRTEALARPEPGRASVLEFSDGAIRAILLRHEGAQLIETWPEPYAALQHIAALFSQPGRTQPKFQYPPDPYRRSTGRARSVATLRVRFINTSRRGTVNDASGDEMDRSREKPERRHFQGRSGYPWRANDFCRSGGSTGSNGSGYCPLIFSPNWTNQSR